MVQQLSATYVTRNGQLGYAPDPLGSLIEYAKNPIADEKVFDAPDRDYNVEPATEDPANALTAHSARGNGRMAAVLGFGTDGVIALPTVTRSSHFTTTELHGSLIDVTHSVDSVIATTVPNKGPIHDIMSEIHAPANIGHQEIVAKGAHLDVLCLKLAALMAEHTLVPVTTPIVPINGAQVVLDLRLTQLRDARHCVVDPALLGAMRDGRIEYPHEPGVVRTTGFIPVYFPSPYGAERAMSLLAALGRDGGPYRHYIQSCFTVTGHHTRFIIASPGGTYNRALANIDPGNLWAAIRDLIDILVQYNNVNRLTILHYYTLMMHNVPLVDRQLGPDLHSVGLTAAQGYPHGRSNQPANVPGPADDDQPLPGPPPNFDVNRALRDAGLDLPPGLLDPNERLTLLGTAARDAFLNVPPPGADIWMAHVRPQPLPAMVTLLLDIPNQPNTSYLQPPGAGPPFWVGAPDRLLNAGPFQDGRSLLDAQIAQRLDAWVTLGMGRVLILGYVADGDLAAVADGAVANSAAHYAQNGLRRFVVRDANNNEVDVPLQGVLAAFGIEHGVALAPPPAAAPAAHIVALDDLAAMPQNLIDRFTLFQLRRVTDAFDGNFPAPAPLPDGFVIDYRTGARFTSAVVENQSAWARNVLDAAVLPRAEEHAQNDPEIAAFLYGAGRTQPNNTRRHVAMLRDYHQLVFRAAWPGWVVEAQDWYRGTHPPAPFGLWRQRHCVYAGGPPIVTSVAYHSGLWPLSYLRRATTLRTQPTKGFLQAMQDATFSASLLLRLRASADLAGVLVQASDLSFTRSRHADLLPAFVQDARGSLMDYFVGMEPYVSAALTHLIMLDRGLYEPSMIGPVAAKDAAPYLTVNGEVPRVGQANANFFLRARVPQLLRTLSITSLLDCSVPEHRYTTLYTPLQRAVQWVNGPAGLPAESVRDTITTRSSLGDELLITLLRSANGLPVRFTYSQHPLREADPIFFNLPAAAGRWDYLPPALRHAPGADITVRDYQFTDGPVRPLVALNGAPDWASPRVNYQPVANYVLRHIVISRAPLTYQLDPPQVGSLAAVNTFRALSTVTSTASGTTLVEVVEESVPTAAKSTLPAAGTVEERGGPSSSVITEFLTAASAIRGLEGPEHAADLALVAKEMMLLGESLRAMSTVGGSSSLSPSDSASQQPSNH